VGEQADEAHGCKTASACRENESVEHGGCLEHPARRDTSAKSEDRKIEDHPVVLTANQRESMKPCSTEANEDNQEQMFHSDIFVSFVAFCKKIG
jgi:hypothetical protein